ncbi:MULTISPECIES: ArsC family reductase [Thalassotalea]|uniref:ArsC family reductase n=1 Tax=Thalassotalea TaxID=1518149 RepID=UPI0009458929|nr:MULTISPECIES: ArsC family reductase [Thalassotalea]OKY27772.1 arsenate reductase [Thalassotalea sp. PP2-459]
MTTLYGIKNCDTVKKARKWLDEHNITYQFHDFRTDGLDNNQLQQFVAMSSWDLLLNKRSTTFRNLDEHIKTNLSDTVASEQVLLQPTLLKRPLLLIDDQLHLGFKAENYQEIFA